MMNWTELLTNFGVSVMVLVAVGYGIWQVGKWVGKELIIPTRDKALARLDSFLNKIESTVAKLDANVGVVTNNLEEQTQTLVSLLSLGRDSNEKTDQVAVVFKATYIKLAEESMVKQDQILRQQSMLLTVVTELRSEVRDVHSSVILAISRLEELKIHEGN